MYFIERIEIQYFRSIYREVITGLRSLNIFTGQNDAGKSNILKALNLFFNNETDPGIPFNFADNFNFQRLGECQNSVKGKQFIQIKITFVRGNRATKTLPARFTVTKKWFRTDTVPSIVLDDLSKELPKEGKLYTDRSKSSITAFLNKIRYIYIPAIKDSDTFHQILSLLRETIYNDRLSQDTQLTESMNILSERIAIAAKELNEEFETATGIKTNLSSPKSVSELYQAISVDTQADNSGNVVSLDGRGDGIRIRYLPSILHYISKNSSNLYIWGFEEPENSLEYGLALKMAATFEKTYCRYSQILVSSHSPAFIGLASNNNNALFRCVRSDNATRILSLSQVEERNDLAKELGYIQIQREIANEFKQKIALLEQSIEQKNRLLVELENLKKPVLYTEGKTDVSILVTAWKKLYTDEECPFEIKSCNTLDEQEGTVAGCDILKSLLVSARPDSPQIIIGLFDNDNAGIRAFSLDNNFYEIDSEWKRHKNKRAHAILLPVPSGKEEFARYRNLCIEFYFEKSDLDKRINGRGLQLLPNQAAPKFNDVPIEIEIPQELHLQRIDSSTKSFFAETVVPTLPVESFVHFKGLFKRVLQVLQYQ